MNFNIRKFITYSLSYLDYSQCKSFAHMSREICQLCQVSTGARHRETVFEAVERAAYQSRATMLAQHNAILAQYPTIRETALMWAYLRDDVDAMRATIMDPSDVDIVVTQLRDTMIAKTMTTTRDYIDICASGLSHHVARANIAIVNARRIVARYLKGSGGSDAQQCDVLARVSQNGELLYVRNNERVVSAICNVFGFDRLREYVAAVARDNDSVATNLNERAYAIRAILLHDRDSVPFVTKIMRAMRQRLIPTDAENARVIADILRLIDNREITTKLLHWYFVSPFFSRELFNIMTHHDDCAQMSMVGHIHDIFHTLPCNNMACASVHMLMQWIARNDHVPAHIMSDFSYLMRNLMYNNAPARTVLAHMPIKIYVESSLGTDGDMISIVDATGARSTLRNHVMYHMLPLASITMRLSCARISVINQLIESEYSGFSRTYFIVGQP